MKKIICFFITGILIVISCFSDKGRMSLKEVYQDHFLIGTALNRFQITGNDNRSMDLVSKEFNTITAENDMKWVRIHPNPGEYSFARADSFVEFGLQNDMFIIGHTLVWHNQTPQWVFEDEAGKPISKEKLLKRLKDHIYTIVGRYKGKVHGWDVINEVFNDAGEFRTDNQWYQMLGSLYLEKAFQWTHEADPDAELYYNDYNMFHEGKRKAVVEFVQKLKAKGIPIHGIGLQGHWGLDYPTNKDLKFSLEAYAETGLKVMITELDITVLPIPQGNMGADINKNFELKAKFNPFPESLPDSMQVVLANRYTELFKMLLDYQDSVSRVTFWGVHDGVSWKNYWPIRGRKDYPLLFNRNYESKLAYDKVVGLVKDKE